MITWFGDGVATMYCMWVGSQTLKIQIYLVYVWLPILALVILPDFCDSLVLKCQVLAMYKPLSRKFCNKSFLDRCKILGKNLTIEIWSFMKVVHMHNAIHVFHDFPDQKQINSI